MPLRSTIVYPLGVIGVQIGMPTTLEMLSAHPEDGLMVAVVVAPGGPDDPIDLDSIQKIGVAGRVSDRLNMPGGTVQATVQGVMRILISDVREESGGYYTGAVLEVYDPALGHVLGGGGCYDGLMKQFGLDLSAAGFGLYLERVHTAQMEESRRGRGES